MMLRLMLLFMFLLAIYVVVLFNHFACFNLNLHYLWCIFMLYIYVVAESL